MELDVATCTTGPGSSVGVGQSLSSTGAEPPKNVPQWSVVADPMGLAGDGAVMVSGGNAPAAACDVTM